MNRLTETQIDAAKRAGEEAARHSVEALQKLQTEVHEAQSGKAGTVKMEPMDLGTGDTMYKDPLGLSQSLKMKNGDYLIVARNGGQIIGLQDKNGKEIAVPGDGENLAPPDAPTEMYRLSNGALYVRDKQSGEQELINKDGSRIKIDDQGICEIQRGHTIVSFGRKLSRDDNFIEFPPAEYGELRPKRN